MEDIFKALQQSEYVHVVLNHLPIIGLLSGLLVLIISLIQKSRATSIAGFLVVFVMALSVIPVTEFGEKAEDQVESLLDAPGRQWLHEHEERAEKAAWLYYATAAAALAGSIVPKFAPGSSPIFLWGTLLLGFAALSLGVWTASAGGKIMHREFRYSPPPMEASE